MDTTIFNKIYIEFCERIYQQEYKTYKELKADVTAKESQKKDGDKTKLSPETKKTLLSMLKKICATVNLRVYEQPLCNITFSGNVDDETTLTSTTKAVIPTDMDDGEWERQKQKCKVLCDVESPEQRSPAWFALRNNVITASNVSTCLGNNPYEPAYTFIMEKIYGRTFTGDIRTYHGRLFEDAIALVYELYHDCKIIQLGIIPHVGDDNGENKKGIIAISPDGLVAPYTSSGKPCKIAGRLVEIKCPFTRKVETSGDYDTVIPNYYLEQVYLQMETTNMDACDFVQCKISRYDSYAEYLNDTGEFHYMSKQYGMPKGAVIELLPINLPADKMINGVPTDKAIHEDTTFIHPPTLLMTNDELNMWLMIEIDKLARNDKVRLHKVIYWKVTQHTFTLVPRSKSRPWFEKNYPKMEDMWNKVLFLRANPDVALEWKSFIDGLSRKMNKTIMKKLDELITQKQEGIFVATVKPEIVAPKPTNNVVNMRSEEDEEEEDVYHHERKKVNYDDLLNNW
jgi:putative phage-type endonuclease